MLGRVHAFVHDRSDPPLPYLSPNPSVNATMRWLGLSPDWRGVRGWVETGGPPKGGYVLSREFLCGLCGRYLRREKSFVCARQLCSATGAGTHNACRHKKQFLFYSTLSYYLLFIIYG